MTEEKGESDARREERKQEWKEKIMKKLYELLEKYIYFYSV